MMPKCKLAKAGIRTPITREDNIIYLWDLDKRTGVCFAKKKLVYSSTSKAKLAFGQL